MEYQQEIKTAKENLARQYEKFTGRKNVEIKAEPLGNWRGHTSAAMIGEKYQIRIEFDATNIDFYGSIRTELKKDLETLAKELEN
jgi:hypothetical protein